MSSWLAESIDDVSSPYDKARFQAGYAVIKDPPKSRERPTCRHCERQGDRHLERQDDGQWACINIEACRLSVQAEHRAAARST